jgi:hypothetical protein
MFALDRLPSLRDGLARRDTPKSAIPRRADPLAMHGRRSAAEPVADRVARRDRTLDEHLVATRGGARVRAGTPAEWGAF